MVEVLWTLALLTAFVVGHYMGWSGRKGEVDAWVLKAAEEKKVSDTLLERVLILANKPQALDIGEPEVWSLDDGEEAAMERGRKEEKDDFKEQLAEFRKTVGGRFSKSLT